MMIRKFEVIKKDQWNTRLKGISKLQKNKLFDKWKNKDLYILKMPWLLNNRILFLI